VGVLEVTVPLAGGTVEDVDGARDGVAVAAAAALACAARIAVCAAAA
jgi:hypothetical protein